MKTPLYETSAGALRTFLASSRKIPYYDLYTIECVSGPTLRYTTADFNIGFGGNVWDAHSVSVDDPSNKALAHWKTGLDTDTWNIILSPRTFDPLTDVVDPDKIGSNGWLQAAMSGALDAAVVYVDRAYMGAALPNPLPWVASPLGVYRIFAGKVSTVDIGLAEAFLTIQDMRLYLDISMPRNLHQFWCVWTLFGPGCNNAGSLPAASFAKNGTVTTYGLAPLPLVVSADMPDPGGALTYALGRLVATSGNNNGFSRMIRTWDPTTRTMVLVSPFPFNMLPGDTITAYPGCNKSLSACQAFDNEENFNGEPYIPIPEVAI